MPRVACDDFRRQLRIDYFVFRAFSPLIFLEAFHPNIRQPSVKLLALRGWASYSWGRSGLVATVAYATYFRSAAASALPGATVTVQDVLIPRGGVEPGEQIERRAHPGNCRYYPGRSACQIDLPEVT